MPHALLRHTEAKYLKRSTPVFQIGDLVDVHCRIVEGDKERIQIFSGTVISRKGTGMNTTFTVRRIVNNEGVERIFPLHSPKIEKLQVKRKARVRRAKLYYLRALTGKATRLKEGEPVIPSDTMETPPLTQSPSPAAGATAPVAAPTPVSGPPSPLGDQALGAAKAPVSDEHRGGSPGRMAQGRSAQPSSPAAKPAPDPAPAPAPMADTAPRSAANVSGISDAAVPAVAEPAPPSARAAEPLSVPPITAPPTAAAPPAPAAATPDPVAQATESPGGANG